MVKDTAILGALLVGLALPTGAGGMPNDIPPEIVAHKSELIVIGQASEVGQPTELELALPDEAKPVKGWFRTYKVKIARVIKDQGASEAERERKTPEDAAEREAAARPAGGTEIAVLARSDPPKGQRRTGRARRGSHPRLVQRWQYVLLLRSLPDRREYYLPSNPMNYARARRTEVARIEKAANVDAWPWGEALAGLQIAVIAAKSVLPFQRHQIIASGADRGKGPAAQRVGGAHVQVVVALRNTSQHPITVNMYKWDKLLSLRATGPDGKTVEHDFYKYYRFDRKPDFDPKYTATIPPGEVLFTGPDGPSQRTIGVSMPLTPGNWKLRAAYSSQRQAEETKDGEEEKAKLWTGKIESAPAAVEVRKLPGFGPMPGK